MKSIIPLLAIPVLVAFALVGCNQNIPSNSTGSPSTNSSATGGITNAPTVNSVPDMNTNMPASTNQ
jgi:hypothetical protein